MTRLLGAVLALLIIPGAACSSASEASSRTASPGASAMVSSSATSTADETPTSSATPDDDGRGLKAAPTLKVSKVAGGLDHPWDVQRIGNGRLLVTERSGRLAVIEKGKVRRIEMTSGLIWASGETGLMGLAIDPKFADNRRFYTCNGGNPQGTHDVRVLVWRMNAAATRATFKRTLIKGFPATSGRHGGCRILILKNGAMLVGTGDAATGTNPRDLTSLGGKTLRLNRITGAPWPKNPFIDAVNKKKRYIHTYGHRNIQGLAVRKDGSLWSAEHGPDRDDEINRLRNGGDYGWNPVPGYNESVPMTDQSLPGRQVAARWSSGSPTLATSGASFVRGRAWGWYDGTLAVAALKASKLVFLRFDAKGKFVASRTPGALNGKYGRLRAVTSLPNGDLLITTDNGGNSDAVLRVRPIG